MQRPPFNVNARAVHIGIVADKKDETSAERSSRTIRIPFCGRSEEYHRTISPPQSPSVSCPGTYPGAELHGVQAVTAS